LRDGLIEETYEVVEALDHGDLNGLRAELGDLFLHIVLHATIAEEGGTFSLRRVLDDERAKLIRRHPHVFGTLRLKDAEEVKGTWERLKMAEGRRSVLEGVPEGLPALQRAHRIQERAGRVGFDWKNPADVWTKVREELEELRLALRAPDPAAREEEFGDLLFSLVNYARFLQVNPENALRATVRKFESRFRFIEEELARQGRDIHAATLEEMDALWQKAKAARAPERARHRAATPHPHRSPRGGSPGRRRSGTSRTRR
jgi:XTP/dITP diphosphohydrolase